MSCPGADPHNSAKTSGASGIAASPPSSEGPSQLVGAIGTLSRRLKTEMAVSLACFANGDLGRVTHKFGDHPAGEVRAKDLFDLAQFLSGTVPQHGFKRVKFPDPLPHQAEQFLKLTEEYRAGQVGHLQFADASQIWAESLCRATGFPHCPKCGSWLALPGEGRKPVCSKCLTAEHTQTWFEKDNRRLCLMLRANDDGNPAGVKENIRAIAENLVREAWQGKLPRELVGISQVFLMELDGGRKEEPTYQWYSAKLCRWLGYTPCPECGRFRFSEDHHTCPYPECHWEIRNDRRFRQVKRIDLSASDLDVGQVAKLDWADRMASAWNSSHQEAVSESSMKSSFLEAEEYLDRLDRKADQKPALPFVICPDGVRVRVSQVQPIAESDQKTAADFLPFHRAAVERALRAGRPVEVSILAEYRIRLYNP